MPNLPIIFLAFANDKIDNARYLRNLPVEQSQIREALASAVEQGTTGMRLWTMKEAELIKKNQAKRERQRNQLIRRLGIAASVLILATLGIAVWQWQVAQKQTVFANKKEQEATKSLQEVQRNKMYELLQRIDLVTGAGENANSLFKEIRLISSQLPEKDSVEIVLKKLEKK